MGEFYNPDKLYKGGSRNNSLINKKMIFRVLGVLLFIESAMFLLCAAISLCYGEQDYQYFLYTILLNTLVGGVLLICSRGAENRLTRRDGYCIVTFTWFLFTLFGMLPFYFSGGIPSVTDAFFETMSGFTTTGATILDDIESLSHGLLFWRSLTQWIGGLGIVFFTIAVLPIFGGGTIQLFSAEAIGVTHDKTHPRIDVMAKWLWMIYAILTIAETVLLIIGGMSFFDAVCHSFSTTATGGYSTKQAGINFSLYFMCLKGKGKRLFQDDEFRWFMKSVSILTLVITLALVFQNHYDWEKAFRRALFQVATAHTSCGFATDDYNLWPSFTWMLLIFAMLSGGCTGSTSGGIKNMRLMILARNIKNEFKRMLHPRAVLPVRVNRQVISPSIIASVNTFFVFYLFCILAGWILLMFFGVGIIEAMSTVISSLGNVGPGLGAFGPAFSWAALPDAAKWILSFLMLIGRLELFAVLLLFYSGFWERR